MNKKKIGLVIIAILILICIASVLLLSNSNQVIKYDDTFNFELPSDFETLEKDGLITEAFPETKEYVVLASEDNSTIDELDEDFKYVEDYSNVSEVKDKFKNLKIYNIGNNKYYDIISYDEETNAEQNSKVVRYVEIVYPGATKPYVLSFASNDTSVNLDTPDIQSIINSTANV